MTLSNGLELYPKLRFKDGTGNDFEAWKKRKFGDFIIETNEKTTKENEYELLSCAINGIYRNSELFSHQRGVSNIGYKVIHINDLILSMQNLHLGNVNVNMDYEIGIISPAYKTYKLQNITPIYMNEYLQTFRAKRMMFSATTTGASQCRRNVEWETLYNSIIYVPTNCEQNKITKFLSQLNQRIKLQESLVESLKKYKRGLINSIWNANWPKKKLSELMTFQNGINASADKYGQGVKYISVSDILDSSYITYESIRGLVDVDSVTLKKYSVTYGDVVFQRSSENREDAGKSNVYLDLTHTAVFGGFVIRGKREADYNPTYVKYALSTDTSRNQIIRKAAGAQHINIGQKSLENVWIKYPEIKVQNQIGSLFTILDQKIDYEEQKINRLIRYRNGLLQVLFI